MFYTCYVYNVCLHNKLPSSQLPQQYLTSSSKFCHFSKHQSGIQSKLANTITVFNVSLCFFVCLLLLSIQVILLNQLECISSNIPRLLCGPSCENFMTRRMSDQNIVPCHASQVKFNKPCSPATPTVPTAKFKTAFYLFSSVDFL